MRTPEIREKHRKAILGSKHTEETKRKMSISRTGKVQSEETKQKLSEINTGQECSVETKQKLSKAMLGRKASIETRHKMSLSRMGNKNPAWQGGVSFGQYCPKFNEKVKEQIRDKYHRRCFECDITEEENGMKLDVHHVDFKKEQGCNDHEWRLIPLCKGCHAKTQHDREKSERHFCILLEVVG